MVRLGERRVSVARVPIVASTAEQAVGEVLTAVARGKRLGSVRFVNAYTLALADNDPQYRSLLRDHGVNYPDGKPLSWVVRRVQPAAEQVRGPWFFNRALQDGVALGVRHFLFGTDEYTLVKLRSRIEQMAPGVRIVGTLAPPMGTVEEILSEETIAAIRDAEPDVVWVGLGTPKQDVAGVRLAERLEGLTCISVGAAFDFTAGTKKEAPAVWRRLGLEWAYRFAQEPHRLWRRYVFGNARFAAAVFRFGSRS